MHSPHAILRWSFINSHDKNTLQYSSTANRLREPEDVSVTGRELRPLACFALDTDHQCPVLQIRKLI